MSEKEKALVSIEQKEVEFYGDMLTAVLVEVDDRFQVFVPIRPICSLLGLNWSGQQQRIDRDPILSEVKGVCVIHTPSSGRRGGGPQEMLCLPLDYLNGFVRLFTRTLIAA